MSRFTFVILFFGLFLVLVGTVQAAPVLSSLLSDGSTINVGDTVDYSWSPVSTRDNCVHFFPPGAAGWENWTCLGHNIGSYSKNTAGLNEGLLSAEAATKKCSFFGLKCSWDYSNVVKVNLVLPPPSTASPPPPPGSTCTSDSNYKCIQLIPSGRTIIGGDSVTTTAKATIRISSSPRKVTIEIDNLPAGVTVFWPNGESCTIPAGQSSCTVNIIFNTSPVSLTRQYSIPIAISPGAPSQNFDLTVEKSKNTPPTATPLRPQPPVDYCISPLTWTLSWHFYDPDADSYQSAYQIKIFDAGTGREILSRGPYYSSFNFFAVPVGALNFNKTYSWKIKVWDNKLATGEASGENFPTIPHSVPKVDFYWKLTGSKPGAGETINFYDETIFYDQIALAAKRKWQWTFGDGLVAIGPDNTYNVQAKSDSRGQKSVTLRTTDADGLTCPKTKTLQIGRSVPKIKEIFPH